MILIDSNYSSFSPLLLAQKIIGAYFESYLIYLHSLGQNLKWASLEDANQLEKIIRSRIRNLFDERFRDDKFVNVLVDSIAFYSNMSKKTGFGQVYQTFSNMLSVWNNTFVEPVRDAYWRTPSQKVCTIEKYSLTRYKEAVGISNPSNMERNTTHMVANNTIKTPLLIVYAFINRHYILDLVPEVSVVRNLLNQGFDIFATDWGTPGAYDRELTIDHFVNTYMDKSIDYIRKVTKSDKVSLFGYCWGGDLVLLYSALHPEKVKNVITVATPCDSEADNTLLSVWTKKMKVDTLLDAFGNVPSVLLNSAFALRNPIEYSLKYPYFFERVHNLESILEFIAAETWLNDSREIIGEIYREFVKYYYQENLFIKNRVKLAATPVDLTKITAPLMNVIALNDDLVSAGSSKALDNVVGSRDKTTLELNSGHVGLLIGSRAHREIWPKVGEWLKERS